MIFGREKINQRLTHVWSDQIGMDDSWLDKIWPESDVLNQIARQRAVDPQSADESDREIVWSDANGSDDSWLDNLWPDSDVPVHVAEQLTPTLPIARSAAFDFSTAPTPDDLAALFQNKPKMWK